jgi:hypothetical protein
VSDNNNNNNNIVGAELMRIEICIATTAAAAM